MMTVVKTKPLMLCLVAVLCCLFFWFFTHQTGGVKFDIKSTQGKHDEPINKKLPKKMDKINKRGEYQPFYGYTIISELQDNAKFTEIADYIRKSKTLSKYFTPLPASSYHVTLFDVLTQRAMPDRYTPKSGNVPSYRWYQAIENLKFDMSMAQEECDHFEGRIVFRKYEYKVGTSGLSILGTVSNMDEISKFRNSISAIFKKSDDPRVYHIGLAYKFKVIDDLDHESVKEELDYLLKHIMKDEYILHRPNLYYFETMEKFTPYMSLNF